MCEPIAITSARTVEEDKPEKTASETHGRFATLLALHVGIEQSASTSSASVVDEDIDTSLFAQNLIDRFLAGFEGSNVEFDAVNARRKGLQGG